MHRSVEFSVILYPLHSLLINIYYCLHLNLIPMNEIRKNTKVLKASGFLHGLVRPQVYVVGGRREHVAVGPWKSRQANFIGSRVFLLGKGCFGFSLVSILS